MFYTQFIVPLDVLHEILSALCVPLARHITLCRDCSVLLAKLLTVCRDFSGLLAKLPMVCMDCSALLAKLLIF